MRHALIIAGGSGTRLWPMSRARLPKQLIPFIHGKSLLQVAIDRLAGLVPADRVHICAAESHRELIQPLLKGSDPASRYYGEPTGRDTLNAVGFAAAVIAKSDPNAVIAVFTADHVIEPVDQFVKIVGQGYAIAEKHPETLVTFGIAPTFAATGYGYLELGSAFGNDGARLLSKFKEKPDAATAGQYFASGAARYLWNSGMFVWRAATVMDCISRYEPSVHTGLTKIADSWGDAKKRTATLAEVYPTLKKISVDFAIMEPASKDAKVKVVAVPMPLTWLDVGSWPSFAQTCDHDAQANAIAAKKHVLIDTAKTLVATSDPNHLITTIGVDNLIVIHTPEATLVCRADRAEDIKKLHQMVGERFGKELL